MHGKYRFKIKKKGNQGKLMVNENSYSQYSN